MSGGEGCGRSVWGGGGGRGIRRVRLTSGWNWKSRRGSVLSRHLSGCLAAAGQWPQTGRPHHNNDWKNKERKKEKTHLKAKEDVRAVGGQVGGHQQRPVARHGRGRQACHVTRQAQACKKKGWLWVGVLLNMVGKQAGEGMRGGVTHAT